MQSHYIIEKIEPFGLKITPNGPASITQVSPELLDELALEEKLVLLRGFDEIGRDDFLKYCQSFPKREILEWDFGPVMDLKERPDPKNYLFSREHVPFHWDGAFHRVPSFLTFCCVEPPAQGAGGETLFSNTEMIWNDASPAEKTLFSQIELTYETEKLAHYGGSITNRLVQTHPNTRKPVLRFAEPVETTLNPVTLKIRGIPEEERDDFLTRLQARAYDPAYCYPHTWERGDILIADNHALIHGRRAFEHDCPRHLRRIQLI